VSLGIDGEFATVGVLLRLLCRVVGWLLARAPAMLTTSKGVGKILQSVTKLLWGWIP